MTENSRPEWTGRTDGPGPEHARWHSTVRARTLDDLSRDARPEADGSGRPKRAVDLIGFASDAGVARNNGRVGAASGPGELRKGLSSLAVHEPLEVTDFGDVVVKDDAGLEPGQDRLSAAVADSVARGAVPCVLGGGHETAWGTFRGIREGLRARDDAEGRTGRSTLGILNLDQHFDLRREERPTSGTPFLQIAELLESEDEAFRYGIVGISEPNNTAVGFETAREHGARWLLDEECTRETAVKFARGLLDSVDSLYMTLDLDVLPASAAPGVSAPAAYGVGVDVIRAVMLEAARSGKLAGFDVVELNPVYDVDSRTAKCAARLINDVVRAVSGT